MSDKINEALRVLMPLSGCVKAKVTSYRIAGNFRNFRGVNINFVIFVGKLTYTKISPMHENVGVAYRNACSASNEVK